MDTLILNRISQKEKFKRMIEGTLNFKWGDSKVQLLQEHYSWPEAFIIKKVYSQNPMEEVFKKNFRSAIEMMKELHYKSQYFVGRQVLAPIGNDYAFSLAHKLFKNIDAVMMIVRSNSQSFFKGINIEYSTPSKYLEVVESLQSSKYPDLVEIGKK